MERGAPSERRTSMRRIALVVLLAAWSLPIVVTEAATPTSGTVSPIVGSLSYQGAQISDVPPAVSRRACVRTELRHVRADGRPPGELLQLERPDADGDAHLDRSERRSRSVPLRRNGDERPAVPERARRVLAPGGDDLGDRHGGRSAGRFLPGDRRSFLRDGRLSGIDLLHGSRGTGPGALTLERVLVGVPPGGQRIRLR